MKAARKRLSGRIANARRKTAVSASKAVLAPEPTTGPRIHSKWRWHYRSLLAVRERLRLERREQLGEAAEPLEQHSMDIADSATDELDHNLALAHLSAEQDALYEVEDALRRIRDGTYGICEETGKRISAARLRAVPWARFCQQIQARLEQKGAVKREGLGRPASLRASASEGFNESEAEGESKAQATPEDEALWNFRMPPADPARSPAKRRRRGGVNQS